MHLRSTRSYLLCRYIPEVHR